MRWYPVHPAVGFVLLAACLRPTAPSSPPPESGALAATEPTVTFREDPTVNGLDVDLYEARPAGGAADRLPTPPATELSTADTTALLARLPALPADPDAAVNFALRQGPTPPPRTGATTTLPFPAAADGEMPAPPAVPTGPLTVLRRQPEGAVPLAPHLSVTFDRPMVALTAADAAAGTVPVTLSPAPEGAWRWLGTKTLLFQPAGRFPMATRYTAEVPAGTRAADGSALEAPTMWTFATPPVALTGSLPDRYTPQSLQPPIFLSFDQKISPEAMLSSITVRAGAKAVPMRLARENEVPAALAARQKAQADRSLVLLPSEPLAYASSYTVTVGKGAPSAEGPLLTEREQSFGFSTHGPLTVVAPTCWERPCRPDASWSITFSNPLDEATVDTSTITVEPAVPGFQVYPGGDSVTLAGAFAPRTTYTVRVGTGIRDTFGQSLAAPGVFPIDVGPADRSFSGPGNPFVTLDPAAPAHLPVHTVNHASLKVEIRKVTAEDWAAWTSWWEEHRWDDARAGVLPGTRVSSTTVTIAKGADERVETPIDLTPYLQGKSGQFIVHVEPTVQPRDRWARSEWTGWVQVTALGLTAIREEDAVTAWVTGLADGGPRADVRVSLLGQADSAAATDKDGLARLPLDVSTGLVARAGDDVALLPAGPWGYEQQWVRQETLKQLRWYIFDDKRLYKPKETVHVRGWLRTDPGDPERSLNTPGGGTVKWTARSSLGNPLGEGTATVSPRGGFTFDVPLPATPDLGAATVSLEADTGWASHSFDIQEYRTPEFEVSASGADGVYTLGEDATVDVAARYYAGGGLASAPVSWQVTSTPATFVPPGREGWTFGPWSPWWWSRWEAPDAPGTPETFAGITDATGEHHLGIHFAALNPIRPMTVRAEATVTDVNRQAWTTSRSFLVHPAAWYVGLKADTTYVGAGKPVRVEALAVDRAGKAVAAGTVVVRLDRLVWKRVGGTWKEVGETVGTETIAGGAGTATFTPPAGGSYALVATVQDTAGRPNTTEMRVWVAGAAPAPDRGVGQDSVTLVPDQKTWSVGATARVLVQAPFWPAEGLLTVRVGGRILETRPFDVTDAVTPITLPITESHIPDVTLAVDIVGSRTRTDDAGALRPDLPKRVAYAGGTVALDVSRRTRALTVAVTPALARLEPGGNTSLAIRVTGPDGAPQAGAELAVVAVDEAVLALSGYELPDPLAVFYGPRGDGIATDHLRQWVELGNTQQMGGLGASGVGFGGGGLGEAAKGDMVRDASPMRTLSTGAPPGAPMAEAKSVAVARRSSNEKSAEAPPEAANTPIQVRSDFSALALWAPTVTTDATGAATVALALPDSLTRYRVMVVAVAGDRFFGTGTADVTARLPLMVRPSAPRFLNFGDRAELPVVLQNQTDAPLTVRVALRTANLGVLQSVAAPLVSGAGQAGRSVVVPANDRVELRFPVAAAKAGTARYQLAASSGAYADAASGELPVWTPATTEAFATYGTFDQDGAIAQPLVPPADVWPQFGGLEVTVASTQLQSLTDAFLYLQTYRYACNEQLASRVLSVAALRDVLTAFDAAEMPSAAEIDATMRADLDKLAQRQNADGGWAFWRRGDPSWPYLGVHVTHALVRARDARLPVDPGSLQRALAYTRTVDQQLPAWYSPESKRVIRAYAVHVLSLAGEPAPGKAKALFAEAGADGLGAQGLGWVLPSLVDAKATKEVATIRGWLANRITETAAGAHFVTDYTDGAHVLLASNRVADGVLLEALLRTTPKDDIVPKLVNGLLANRKAGRWSNTAENAHILLALDRYFKVYEGVTPDFVARVWLGDGFAGEQTFSGRTTDRAQIDVPMAWLQDKGAQDVTVGKTGPGRLYYRLGLRYAPTDLDVDAADYGFAVTRRYEPIDDPADVSRDADGTWVIKAGARVRVRLEMVTPMRRYHVALVDPLPAGLEVLNPDLAVTGTVPGDPTEAKPFWWWSRPWFEHENLRDERVEAFTTLLWEGVHTYTYVARATTPGDFVVPPTKAEEMYSPETFGRTDGDRVIVR